MRDPKNYYHSSEEHPFHLSVGAVLVNEKGEVAAMNVTEWRGLKGFTLLMRETMEFGESLEETLHRGLLEELGAEATVETFLGTIVSHFLRGAVDVEKTTPYFLCRLVSIDTTKIHDGDDGEYDVVWMDIEELARKSKEQGVRFGRSDFDESVVLERAMRYLVK